MVFHLGQEQSVDILLGRQGRKDAYGEYALSCTILCFHHGWSLLNLQLRVSSLLQQPVENMDESLPLNGQWIFYITVPSRPPFPTHFSTDIGSSSQKQTHKNKKQSKHS